MGVDGGAAAGVHRQCSARPAPVMDARADPQLVAALAAGDLDALSELYQRHHQVVYRFARQMTGSAPIAEDVTQEVFLGLLRSARHFDPTRGALTTYLYVITRNLVLKQIRRPRAAGLDALEAVSVDEREGPYETTLRDEVVDRVRDAVSALPPHYREVVVLCDLHERTYAEAAQVVGCREGTIRSRLHRARAILAATLRDGPKAAPKCRDMRCTA